MLSGACLLLILIEMRGSEMKIKAWVMGAVALATAGTAWEVQAADFGGGTPYVAVNNWAGFYAGANLGFAHTNVDVSASICCFGGGFLGAEGSASDTQFTIGVLAGYNWQSGDRVWGVEGDINDVGGGTLGSIRGRYGFASDNWLYYGTAGVGFTDSATGLVVGGGAETKIGHNLSAGVEGLFYWFPDVIDSNFGLMSVKADAEVIAVRARLTYHFDGSRDFLK
jgi:outer membrane immunogenic protein